jgi:hypothetical protein
MKLSWYFSTMTNSADIDAFYQGLTCVAFVVFLVCYEPRILQIGAMIVLSTIAYALARQYFLPPCC